MSNRSFEAALQIFNSSVLGTLLYASPIWSLRYLNQLESAQNYFFKSYISLKFNTPHYIIRKEFSLKYVAVKILKQVLGFINSIHASNENSLLKKCFQRLIYLDSVKGNSVKYNWVSQVKQLLMKTTHDIDLILNGPFSNAIIESITQSYSSILDEEDFLKVCNSSYSSLYYILNSFNDSDTSYLNKELSLPFTVQRVLAQIRTAGLDTLKITIKGILYIVKVNEVCQVCNMREPESLAHVFLRCPMYKPHRAVFLPIHLTSNEFSDNTNVASILGFNNKKEASNIFYFVSNMLKTRSFLLNE